MQTLHALEPTETGVASVAFGPDNTVLYSSPLLQQLIELDLEQDRVLRKFDMHCNATAMNVSLCGSAVAFADANGAVGLFRYQGGELFLLQGTTSRFEAWFMRTLVCLLRNTFNWQASLELCGLVIVIALSQPLMLAGQCLGCQTLHFSPDGQYVLAGAGSTMIVYSIKN